MTTITQKLADALRPMAECLHGGITLGIRPGTPQAIAIREALVAYDAQQAATPSAVRVDGQEMVGHEWDSGPQAWDVVRTENEEWICLADPEHSARIARCVNAHDGLVGTLRTIANLQAFAMTDGRGMQGDNAKELNRIIGAALASVGEATP